ncbi:MAG: GatB/YqeY domain-containing protein [Patescibacteria group bacterium]
MSKIADNIKTDLISAQKSGDKRKVEILRMVLSELKNRQIDTGKELTEEEAQEVLRKEAKKRQDSIVAYRDAGRDDLLKAEEHELELINGYLPALMSEDEIKVTVQKIVSENPSLDFGPLMGKVMGQLKGKADGTLVKKVAQGEIKK